MTPVCSSEKVTVCTSNYTLQKWDDITVFQYIVLYTL